jgi:hypothetical protein
MGLEIGGARKAACERIRRRAKNNPDSVVQAERVKELLHCAEFRKRQMSALQNDSFASSPLSVDTASSPSEGESTPRARERETDDVLLGTPAGKRRRFATKNRIGGGGLSKTK